MTGAGAVAAIVLLAWAVGLVAGSTWVQTWAVVKRGHFRIVGWVTVITAALAAVASVPATDLVAGGSAQRTLAFMFVASVVVHLISEYGSSDATPVAAGVATSVIGVLALVTTAGLLEEWSPLLSIPALLVAAGLLGLVTNGMLLGHWYLNQPGLKPWALARLTIAALVATVLSGVVGVASAGQLVSSPTEGAALGLPGFGSDLGPAFFFVWVGLVAFTGAVLFGARRCIAIRSIQSATGLYYVAILTAGVAEFLVRYLMVGTR